MQIDDTPSLHNVTIGQLSAILKSAAVGGEYVENESLSVTVEISLDFLITVELHPGVSSSSVVSALQYSLCNQSTSECRVTEVRRRRLSESNPLETNIRAQLLVSDSNTTLGNVAHQTMNVTQTTLAYMANNTEVSLISVEGVTTFIADSAYEASEDDDQQTSISNALGALGVAPNSLTVSQTIQAPPVSPSTPDKPGINCRPDNCPFTSQKHCEANVGMLEVWCSTCFENSFEGMHYSVSPPSAKFLVVGDSHVTALVDTLYSVHYNTTRVEVNDTVLWLRDVECILFPERNISGLGGVISAQQDKKVNEIMIGEVGDYTVCLFSERSGRRLQLAQARGERVTNSSVTFHPPSFPPSPLGPAPQSVDCTTNLTDKFTVSRGWNLLHTNVFPDSSFLNPMSMFSRVHVFRRLTLQVFASSTFQSQVWGTPLECHSVTEYLPGGYDACPNDNSFVFNVAALNATHGRRIRDKYRMSFAIRDGPGNEVHWIGNMVRRGLSSQWLESDSPYICNFDPNEIS